MKTKQSLKVNLLIFLYLLDSFSIYLLGFFKGLVDAKMKNFITVCCSKPLRLVFRSILNQIYINSLKLMLQDVHEEKQMSKCIEWFNPDLLKRHAS